MPSSKSKRPALQVTWIRDNKADGEARYRVQVFGKDARTFDIRISLKAKYQAKPSPEEKIEEWFKFNPLAGSGVSMKIPDDHFCTRDNEIIRYLRSWLQSVSRIRSFHCHRMRSESESQFTCAARLPVKSALP